ncbi:MAG: cohesin domain-containing protein [Dehalococcoidales bacterium]|nr:cohesin domain-containing protein [Dehalococcoidales bacterium]
MRRYISLVIVMLSVLALSGCSCIRNQMADSTIKVVPSKSVVKPGDKFTVDILITPASGINIAGVQFNLAFNPSSVKINGITEGPLFKSLGGSYFAAGVLGPSSLTNVYGVALGAGKTATAAGVMCTIQCEALSTGSTNFSLSGLVAGNKEGIAVPLAGSANQVTVALAVDLNLDGIVNSADLSVFSAAFGAIVNPPGSIRADCNEDGVVNILDAIMLGQAYVV